MVHGNNSTRSYEKPNLTINLEYKKQYAENILNFKNLSNFILSLRFLKEVDHQMVPDLEGYVMDSLESIEPIRAELGGPIDE